MASTIKLKNGSGEPLASDLVQGEPALDLTNKRLYTEDSGGTVIEVGTNPTSLTTGNITTTGAVDVTGDLDVDNINIDGNTISSTDTNGNIAITPNGTGEVDISKVDIDSGTIDDTVIGGTTTAAGSFTTLQADTSLNVDGTVTADGLTVDGDFVQRVSLGNATSTFHADTNASPVVTLELQRGTNDTWGADAYGDYRLQLTAGDLNFDSAESGVTSTRATFGANGDISFYDTAGSTAGFHWDAADESLGIGTTTPGASLDIANTTLGEQFRVGNGSAFRYLHLVGGATSISDVPNSEAMIAVADANFSGITGAGDTGFLVYRPRVDSSASRSGHAFFTGSPSEERMRIDAGGDISFYEDTGTTAKFFWDASAESLGIGTSSPSAPLMVLGTSDNTTVARFGGSSDSRSLVYSTANQSDGASNPNALHKFQVQSSVGQYKFSNTANDILFLDYNGNVGIGESSPDSLLQLTGDTATITIEDNSAYSADSVTSRIYFNGKDSAGANRDLANIAVSQHAGASGTGSIDFQTRIAGTTASRMRIDSSGNLLVGTESALGTYGERVAIEHTYPVSGMSINQTSASTTYAVEYRNQDNLVGSVSCTTTSTAFNTSSDYRLKENVVDMTGAVDRVKSLNPSQFNFIAEPDRTVDGFLAHEVADVVPEAVTGTKDAMRTEEYEVTPAVLDDDGNVVTEAVMGTREVPDYQGIDQSKLVPLLTGALQEAIARIETLEAQVATLQGN